MFRKIIVLGPAILLTMLFFSVTASGQSYQHSLNVDKMTFAWTIDGDQMGIKISAPTKGWVAVGFNPSSKMKDADIIIGYVKNGKVTITDEFGTAATQHKSDEKVGGADNVTVIGGVEEGNQTTLEFSIPLNSGDEKDTAIDPNGDTIVILGYGPDRDSFKVKHEYRTTITVNLGNGTQK